MIAFSGAKKIIAATQKNEAVIGQPDNVAVVDTGGILIADERMDRTWFGSIDISIKKAFTSRPFDIASKNLAKQSQPGGQFFGIHTYNDSKVIVFAGGIPLNLNGQLVGNIRVSSGAGDLYKAAAYAVATAFQKEKWEISSHVNSRSKRGGGEAYEHFI